MRNPLLRQIPIGTAVWVHLPGVGGAGGEQLVMDGELSAGPAAEPTAGPVLKQQVHAEADVDQHTCSCNRVKVLVQRFWKLPLRSALPQIGALTGTKPDPPDGVVSEGRLNATRAHCQRKEAAAGGGERRLRRGSVCLRSFLDCTLLDLLSECQR